MNKHFLSRFWMRTTHVFDVFFLDLTKATIMTSTDHICVKLFSLTVEFHFYCQMLFSFYRKIENQLQFMSLILVYSSFIHIDQQCILL